VPHRTKQPAERDPHIVIVLDEDQGQRGGDGQKNPPRIGGSYTASALSGVRLA